jgi:hypothetical protein
VADHSGALLEVNLSTRVGNENLFSVSLRNGRSAPGRLTYSYGAKLQADIQ